MFEMLLIEGLAIGACYGLFGVAVAIIYKTSDVVNFAQGEMGMMATFVAYHIMTAYGWPFYLAFPATLLFAVLLGMAIEICFLRPAKEPTVLGLLILTLGAEMLLMGLAGWKWGAEQKDFPFLLSVHKNVEIFPGFALNEWTIGVFVLTAVVMVLLFLFSVIPNWALPCGRREQNENAAKIMGIKVEGILHHLGHELSHRRAGGHVFRGPFRAGPQFHDGALHARLRRGCSGRAHQHSGRCHRRPDPGHHRELFLVMSGRSGSRLSPLWSLF